MSPVGVDRESQSVGRAVGWEIAQSEQRQPSSVAVLFSGGDAPGMNAFLRFFVRLGLHTHGTRVLGVKNGYAGLVRAVADLESGAIDFSSLRERVDKSVGVPGLFDRRLDIVSLDHVAVSGLSSKGGIVLGAARSPWFHSASVRDQVFHLLVNLGVRSLVAVGGNGTLAGARQLANETGLHVVGIPATIDNDIVGTETTLGFDTAVNNAMCAIEQLNDTAGSHHRIIVVETMGRDCGNLAKRAALAGGAEIVVLPERGPLTTAKMEGIERRLRQSFLRGQTHAIVVVAEGVKADRPAAGGPSATLRKFLESQFEQDPDGFDTVAVRDVVLGHLQRGGSPSAADRVLAAQLANAAWDAILHSTPCSGLAAVRRGRIEVCAFDDSEIWEPATIHDEEYRVQKTVTSWG